VTFPAPYPQPNYTWSSAVWPPPTYYTGFGPFTDDRNRDRFIHPIDNEVVEFMGKRVLRYMLPSTPVQPGSLRLGGYVFDDSMGVLYDFPTGDGNPGRVVGTIDYTSGLIIVDIEVSTHLSRRRAEWYAPAVQPSGC